MGHCFVHTRGICVNLQSQGLTSVGGRVSARPTGMEVARRALMPLTERPQSSPM